jgi:adenylate kinase family enzyme
MKRVLVIGGPGSGKSTLARRLHAMTGLPLFHLDQLFWRPGWRKTPKAEWESTLRQLAAREEWIMDGCYDSSFHIRMPRADTVIWLDLPRRVAFPRVLRRIAMGFGRVRQDAAPGCPEWLDWEFLRWAWTFRRAHEAVYRQALVEYASHANVYIFSSSPPANRFLENLRSSSPKGGSANNLRSSCLKGGSANKLNP